MAQTATVWFMKQVYDPRQKPMVYTTVIRATEKVVVTKDALGVNIIAPALDGEGDDVHVVPWSNVSQCINVPFAKK